MKSAAQMSANWTKGMQNPTTVQKYKDGINGFQGNPMALAAAPDAEARYLANVQASVSSGKRQQKLNSVPAQRWKDNAVNVGANALATGAVKAKPKVDDHFQRWAPVYNQMSDVVKSMPKGGMANAMARVQAAIGIAMQAAGRS